MNMQKFDPRISLVLNSMVLADKQHDIKQVNAKLRAQVLFSYIVRQ